MHSRYWVVVVAAAGTCSFVDKHTYLHTHIHKHTETYINLHFQKTAHFWVHSSGCETERNIISTHTNAMACEMQRCKCTGRARGGERRERWEYCGFGRVQHFVHIWFNAYFLSFILDLSHLFDESAVCWNVIIWCWSLHRALFWLQW